MTVLLSRLKVGCTVVILILCTLMYMLAPYKEPENIVSLTDTPIYFSLFPPLSRINLRIHPVQTKVIDQTRSSNNSLTDGPLDRDSFVSIEEEQTVNQIFIKIYATNPNTSEWDQLIDDTIFLMDEITVTEAKNFDLDSETREKYLITPYKLSAATNSSSPVVVSLNLLTLPTFSRYEVYYALMLLLSVYGLIIFEVFHRTTSVLIGSFCSIGVLSIVRYPPTFKEVVGWIDFDTIGLLYGMMIMVAIFSETGFFEFVSIRAYKISRGNLWRLTLMLCTFTALVSSVLDNVTTMLLVAPVTIRLCQVLNVDPVLILISEVIFSNVGGTATPIGDPPNIILFNNPLVIKSGLVTFFGFTVHVGLGIIFVMAAAMLYLWKFLGPKLHVKEGQVRMQTDLERELEVWKATAASIGDSKDEIHAKSQLENHIENLGAQINAEKRVKRMVKEKEKERLARSTGQQYRRQSDEDEEIEEDDDKSATDVVNLEEKYKIHDRPQFVISCFTLSVVIGMFFLHNAVDVNLSLVWIALFGSVVHIVLSGTKDLEHLLHKVEWSTLLFFAGLFVTMRCLEELGLIAQIANLTSDVIQLVPVGNWRLIVAIILILWVSAFVSAFIDNIPYMTTLVPVVANLSARAELPLTPLLWALSFGACLGGNGTLIGASANVITCGLAEGSGHPISFMRFLKFAFPIMILTVFVANIYLLIFHVAIPWY
eukprot:TRINITY_DN1843_c0_g1_i1.p1 TRINITY_DN1843_c0_g1~~TRINITY_DN1843_c0_g1_i1.p1  ORF type:complete len:710 (-),score=124.55 TRINITY_DN1843_c0_g1_i1:150-2279(-)